MKERETEDQSVLKWFKLLEKMNKGNVVKMTYRAEEDEVRGRNRPKEMN